jgi:hypothetical protein
MRSRLLIKCFVPTEMKAVENASMEILSFTGMDKRSCTSVKWAHVMQVA